MTKKFPNALLKELPNLKLQTFRAAEVLSFNKTFSRRESANLQA